MVGMALIASWFVAVLVAPLVGVTILKQRPAAAPHAPPEGRLLRVFSRALLFTMRRPRATVLACLGALVVAIALSPLVPRQFSPHPTGRNCWLTCRCGRGVDQGDGGCLAPAGCHPAP
ncbi:hypothetical protein RAA17_18665 [Komagataeibacter rhaeticus]|nr:hypothetical protein [Komagataeibacter rhaeticus]